MKLCIADPPYPPFHGSGGRKNRASRWYGNKQRSQKDRPADRHPEAHLWDDPAEHFKLLLRLLGAYDGFVIATSIDGLQAYQPLPPSMRVMAWVKPNACPGSHRILSKYEVALVQPPEGRRSNRSGRGAVSDVLIANAPRVGFHGGKPEEWTHWVLDALSYDPDQDTVVDLFNGSGLVKAAIKSYVPRGAKK